MARKTGRRERLIKAFRCVGIVLLACVLLISALITVNDAADWGILPTWAQLFSAVGLTEKPLSSDTLRLTFFDVGNADCLLVQCGGKAMLVDAGEHTTAADVLKQLQTLGIEHLDYVIATHADADHIGGMEMLFRELTVGTFVMPPIADAEDTETDVYRALMSILEQKRILQKEADYGLTCKMGAAELCIISGRNSYDSENDRSAICRLSFGKHTFLLMGDAGSEVEQELMLNGEDLRADVIKIGHHGGEDATDPRFIRSVNPQYAVITCGVDNPFGHPHERTLNTLRECEVAVYRSDYHGNVVFTSDGAELLVSTER